MKMAEIREMPDDKLRALSLEKQTKGKAEGCATSDALKAQKVIFERAGCPYRGTVVGDHMGTKRYQHGWR